MTIVLKHNAPKQEIAQVLQKLKSNKKKGFDAKKYSGILKLKGNPLKIQKALRNEWR